MKNKETTTRRDFIKRTAAVAGLAPLSPYLAALQKPLETTADQLEVHVFSKHLQFLAYEEMAARVADIGYNGVDLTVRPRGHVLPERVTEDLPRAVEALQKAALPPKLMVTAVNNGEDPTHRKVVETAAGLGMQDYRMGYISYPKDKSIPEAMSDFQKQMKKLAKFNRKLGIRGAYQNHAGKRVGAMIWDIWHLLEKADPAALGCQYDIRHAMVEGGQSWETGLRLIHSRIHTIVLKDFIWKKVDGRWRVVNVPLGEGMVDFVAYFRLLKKYGIQVPASMHLEYDLGGAEHGTTELDKAGQKRVFAAMKKDLERARAMWLEA